MNESRLPPVDSAQRRLRMPVRLDSLLVSVTEACHVGCRQCGFIGSTRDREAEPDEMYAWVRQACDYGVPMMIFTGGEPFERFDVLSGGVAAAAEFGVDIGIFTSSYWAKTREVADSTLAKLPGVSWMYLSTDVFHQRSVPYEYVYNAIEASLAAGVRTIVLCITYTNEEELHQVRDRYEAYRDVVIFHEDRVIPTPYLSKVLKHQAPKIPPLPENYGRMCYLLTPLVNPNGDLISCHIGKVGAHRDVRDLPYWLGNLREQRFGDIMAGARQRRDYQFLRTHGPKGIAQLLADNPALTETVGSDGFVNCCNLCFSVLGKPDGRQALHDHVAQGSVQKQIDTWLTLAWHEGPIVDPAEESLLPVGKEGN